MVLPSGFHRRRCSRDPFGSSAKRKPDGSTTMRSEWCWYIQRRDDVFVSLSLSSTHEMYVNHAYEFLHVERERQLFSVFGEKLCGCFTTADFFATRMYTRTFCTCSPNYISVAYSTANYILVIKLHGLEGKLHASHVKKHVISAQIL